MLLLPNEFFLDYQKNPQQQRPDLNAQDILAAPLLSLILQTWVLLCVCTWLFMTAL